MSDTDRIAHIEMLNPHRLALIAQVSSPDSPDSLGAQFLRRCADAAIEIVSGDFGDLNGVERCEEADSQAEAIVTTLSTFDLICVYAELGVFASDLPASVAHDGLANPADFTVPQIVMRELCVVARRLIALLAAGQFVHLCRECFHFRPFAEFDGHPNEVVCATCATREENR